MARRTKRPIPQGLLEVVTADQTSPSGLRYTRRLSNRTPADLRAGTQNPAGYWLVGYQGKQYMVARVILALAYGDHPDMESDHINEDVTDNRLENLRWLDPALNTARQKATICQYGDSFEARITIRGKGHYLGRYNTKEEAEMIYNQAKTAAVGEVL